ncbi:hypothetical protein B0H13DRAFT_1905598 [Mycena leptocephala]|nr:hypothetical protein B0H13DRAFT_1905598 [Mycena leptocephala]
MKKAEPQLNTFSRALTYFSRSNTDVTSLLSGTAVKAVVSYVSDYVSKIGLKSYQAFASVFDVFERNRETLDNGSQGEDTAKTLMRQMINSMSTKMEIGSPMASMYILGNPDHYCSHKPLIYENVNLYEWVQCSEKKARSRKERREFEEQVKIHNELTENDEGIAFNQDYEPEYDADSDLDDFIDDDLAESDISIENNSDSDNDSDWNSEDEDAIIVEKENQKSKAHRVTRHPFLPAHEAAFMTHAVHCDFKKLDNIIPNFMGGAVPRADKGDREYYSLADARGFKGYRIKLGPNIS